MTELTDPFTEHRRLLFSVAYDLLGSAVDAEDVVQETWLRWAGVDQAEVREPRAYLVRIATRQALNRIRANRARRESYIGPWLPEPLLTEEDSAQQVVDRLAQQQLVPLAMMVVLETLSPDERVVFVLREVFGMAHEEIAAVLDRTSASVRQLAHRAREHVHARRPRFDTDAAEQRAVTTEFLTAASTGDLAGLLAMLAPEVTLISDGGGGATTAARRPVVGADKVARLVVGLGKKGAGEDWSVQFGTVNGTTAILAYQQEILSQAVVLDLLDGKIANIYIVANPAKLGTMISE